MYFRRARWMDADVARGAGSGDGASVAVVAFRGVAFSCCCSSLCVIGGNTGGVEICSRICDMS